MKILENWSLKIIAFLFAITLWFYVQGRDVVETAIRFNIFFSNIPQNLYIDEINASEILVWVKGPKHIVSNLMKNEKKIEFNVKGQRAGKFIYEIKQEKLNLPSNTQVLRIQPEKITVRFLPFMEKRVKVVAQYNGIRKYSIEPKYVVVRGPRNIVDNMNYILTDFIDSNEKQKEIIVKIIVPNDKVIVSNEIVKIIFK